MSKPVMVDIRTLLERCDREDKYAPHDRRYLYTLEIRHLLGIQPPTEGPANKQDCPCDGDGEPGSPLYGEHTVGDHNRT